MGQHTKTSEGKFRVIYRVSNTDRWLVFGTFETIEEARAARKEAIASGFKAHPVRDVRGRIAVSGKILGWNIEPIPA